MRKLINAAACALLLGLSTQAGLADVTKKGVWSPLDETYLKGLYANKTWIWKNGAAFFAADGTFSAWSRDQNALIKAIGTWEAVPDGKLCFSASWQADPKPASAPAVPVVKTCFSHKVKGREIAQRKDPDGDWYIFKHSKAKRGDEIMKLRNGKLGLKAS